MNVRHAADAFVVGFGHVGDETHRSSRPLDREPPESERQLGIDTSVELMRMRHSGLGQGWVPEASAAPLDVKANRSPDQLCRRFKESITVQDQRREPVPPTNDVFVIQGIDPGARCLNFPPVMASPMKLILERRSDNAFGDETILAPNGGRIRGDGGGACDASVDVSDKHLGRGG